MAEKKEKSKKSKDSILTTSFALLILLPMTYLMLPTVIFLFLGMLPTLVALILDSGSKSKFKYKWLCVGGLNFAGSLPFLFRLWFGNNTWDGAVGMFINGGAFLIIYLAACVGWIFYRCIPPAVLSFLEMTDQRRVVLLREAQAKLIAKWGEEVAGTTSVKKSSVPASANSVSESGAKKS